MPTIAPVPTQRDLPEMRASTGFVQSSFDMATFNANSGASRSPFCRLTRKFKAKGMDEFRDVHESSFVVHTVLVFVTSEPMYLVQTC